MTAITDVAPAFVPTRAAALARLAEFVPHAGRNYAARRNFDLGAQGHPHVSRLSPYLRHRLLSETEVLRATLGRHSLDAAEKFVQEVFWRTYWKGWLEMRPGVWAQYRAGLNAARDRLATSGGLRADWEGACKGETGIDCFDHWARELAATGYLHNHARMWFASIWIFTLRLPWELGADFFLRHLLDGDPASNTLGWRWVGGLQTRGKTYLARADNIARFTDGRFNPQGQLADRADPLDGPPPPAAGPPPETVTPDTGRKTGWLLTEDDLLAGFPGLPETPSPVCVMVCTDMRSPLLTAQPVLDFTSAAMEDTLSRHADRFSAIVRPKGPEWSQQVVTWARDSGLEQIVAPYTPVGPGSDRLAAIKPVLHAQGIPLVQRLRPFDAYCWPHATHGFFRFKDKIPSFVASIKGLHST